MADLFRSAFSKTASYLSQANPQIFSGFSGGETHPLIGQQIEFDAEKYKIQSLIAEGGFALVFTDSNPPAGYGIDDIYLVQNSKGDIFALKKQLAVDRQTEALINNEIKILRQLSGHPSIIRYYNHKCLAPKQPLGRGHLDYFLLSEFCSGGPLIDVLKRQEFSCEQICKIFHSVASAVHHMHDRNPPITHRDLKIENLLIDNAGFIRLCDFGSATFEIFRPDDNWNALMRAQLEEDMAKFTTPMYRAPEILDTYQNYPIGPAQDIWALGCVLYYLCYRRHPFEDSAKLRIINAKYTLSEESPHKIFHGFIRSTLNPDPYSRPTIQDLYEQVQDIVLALNIDLNEPVFPPNQGTFQTETPRGDINKNNSVTEASSSTTEQFANQLKDQSISLLKNLREKATTATLSDFKSQFGFLNQQQNPKENVDSSLPQKSSQPPVGSNQANSYHQKLPARPPPPTISSSAIKFEQKLQQPTRESDEYETAISKRNVKPQQPTTEKCTLLNDGQSQTMKTSIKKSEDFFSNLDWSNIESKALPERKTAEEIIPEPPKRFLHASKIPATPFPTPNESCQQTPRVPTPDYPTTTHEDHKIIEVVQSYSVDDRKKNGHPTIDLLDELAAELDALGSEGASKTSASAVAGDFFDQFPAHPQQSLSAGHSHPTSSTDLVNLLGDDTNDAATLFSNFHRNASTPNFVPTMSKNEAMPAKKDPLSDFLKDHDLNSNPNAKVREARPNYSRTLFDDNPPVNQQKPSICKGEAMFDDLLSSQGFVSSQKQSNRSLADMGRAIEIKDMDPVQIKIRDWIEGKERNIRALLGSLGDVIWDDAKVNWSPPNMAELLTDSQIKKHYRRACLVVHPDKQVGTEHELLAKAIFTELNDAWNEFESSNN